MDIKAVYKRAVRRNLDLWRRRLLDETKSADQWQAYQGDALKAIAAGLQNDVTQQEAARLAIDLAPSWERWGQWSEWISLLETVESLELPPGMRSTLLLAQSHMHLLNGNFQDAVRLLETALALAESLNDAQLMASAHSRLATTYLRKKEYAKAQHHGEMAFRWLPAKSSKTLPSLYNAMGLISLGMGEFATGEQWFRQALTHWLALDMPIEMGRTWLNLGVLFYQQGQLQETKKCYEQARQILEPTASVVDKLKVFNGLGTLHYIEKNLKEAERIFREGVIFAQGFQGVFHLRGSLTHNLGNTLLALDQLVEAKRFLEKSISLWQQANDDVERANSIGTLAELYEKQQAYALAADHYHQAITLLKEYPEHQWANKLLVNFEGAYERCMAQLPKRKGVS